MNAIIHGTGFHNYFTSYFANRNKISFLILLFEELPRFKIALVLLIHHRHWSLSSLLITRRNEKSHPHLHIGSTHIGDETRIDDSGEKRTNRKIFLPSRALPKAGNDSHADCQSRMLGDATTKPANEMRWRIIGTCVVARALRDLHSWIKLAWTIGDKNTLRKVIASYQKKLIRRLYEYWWRRYFS